MTKLHRMIRALGRSALPLLAAVLLVFAATQTPRAAETGQDAIIGTWVVKAPDAPFTHHMFVFNADGNMQQANPDAGNPDNSDSDGKGIWIREGDVIKGKFVEVTADRKTAKFVSRGEVSFEITAIDKDSFTGTASAKFYDDNDKLLRGPFPTPLYGKRVTLP
ncbi:hypothetical protein [Paracoccus aminophilus]|uniref:DUF2147 domain-containing protein n=1 Tax=Paracoccus aminophilus JCM 7686 TaxID=1367847 RepID=S5YGN4_PARAH|nr:hypothetical protein [Paracoccus aminophilus]AGT10618.1 hypothetical protein JCM7686_pAMI1p032 [Paracoccus aminophilus JCM 7686]